MKTTVTLSDDLLSAAKRLANRERTTLRALLEEGLRWVLSERRPRDPYQMPDRSVPGNGLQPGIQEGDWEHIRRILYEGRGE